MSEVHKPIVYADRDDAVKGFLETLGTVVSTRNRRFFRLPFWLEEVDGNLRILDHEEVPEYVKNFMEDK